MLVMNEGACLHFTKDGCSIEWRQGNQIQTKPVSSTQLYRAFKTKDEDSGWLDPHIRRCGVTGVTPWFLSYYPPQKLMTFIGQATIWMYPYGMVFAGKGENYWLFMQMDAEVEFRHDLRLIAAPFPNVDKGRICYGQNNKRLAEMRNAEYMWQLFWRSPFNRDYMTGNKLTFMRAMIAAAEKGEPDPNVHNMAKEVAAAEGAISPKAIVEQLMNGGNFSRNSRHFSGSG